MRFLIFIFILLLIMSPAVTQGKKVRELEVVEKIAPKPFSISTNIVFVIDASSTINVYPGARRKFELGWKFITQHFVGDQVYFRAYLFHDAYKERRTKWIDAGGPNGAKQFRRAYLWAKKHTGIASYGLKAIRMALRERNPLDKNKVTSRGLTVVLFTDGGLTEAANGRNDATPMLKSSIKDHVYGKYGNYIAINKMIAIEQKGRLLRGLFPATIVVVGIENVYADLRYGTSVKRPNKECQWWLRKLGRRYHGGYTYIRYKK